jgi:lipoprotein-releasing system permease protein
LSAEKFIADRILRSRSADNKGNISRPIVKIAVTGIALGVVVMLVTVAIVLGFKNEIIAKITGLTTHIAISNMSVAAGGEPSAVTISADTIRMLRSLPQVQQVQPVAFKNGLLKTGEENEGIVMKGVNADYDFAFIARHLVAGRLPEFPKEEAGKEVLISHTLSNRLGLKLNDKILVYFISQHEVYDSIAETRLVKSEQRSRKFSVCGIFKTGFAEYDDRLCIGDIRQLRRINYWPENAAGSYEIAVMDFRKVDATLEQVQDLLGFSYQASTVKEIYSNIFIWLDKLDVNGIIIVVLMVLVAIVNMITALLILILERSSMIGLLKAVGMANVSVRRIFLRISMQLAGRGLLWGNITAILLLLLQYHFKFVSLDSETYYVDHVAIELDWGWFALLNLGTLLVCALMLWLPTLIVGRLTPVRTLKWD